MRYLVMSRSLTYAQRAARALERSFITAGVIKAPAGLSKNGCAYSVAVSINHIEDAVRILKKEGLLHGKVYLQKEDNSVEEVIM